MTIRLARICDAEAISTTLREAFAEFESLYTPAGFSATTPSKEQIEARFGEGSIWVAELAGKLVGTVAAVPRGTELYIRSMAVIPTARGQGAGTLLLNATESFAAEHHYRRLVLNTTPFLLGAVRLYERHWFRLTGEQSDLEPRWPRWPKSCPRNAVNFSSARTTKRFPSLRCAFAIRIVRPSESTVATQPQLQPSFHSRLVGSASRKELCRRRMAGNARLQTRCGNAHWSLRELPDHSDNTQNEDRVDQNFKNVPAFFLRAHYQCVG